jgi:hypothetical protein
MQRRWRRRKSTLHRRRVVQPARPAFGACVEQSTQLLHIQGQAASARLERFPIEWSHSIDQKSLQIQKLEHILVDQIEPI